MKRNEIFQKIAELVGLPKNCTKATIYLDIDKVPAVECRYLVGVEKDEDRFIREVTG